MLYRLRISGYRLASHWDTVEDGQPKVSWLFVNKDGDSLLGVGDTDLEGLEKAYQLAVEKDTLVKRYPYVSQPKRPAKMLVSPFRYPGAKGRHMDVICQLADFSSFAKSRYVEPFAGGGSSLFYLMSKYGMPREVVMNDLDASVAAFWRCMENEKLKTALTKKVLTAKVTVKERERQRPLMESKKVVEAAFAGIFISRTSFSGVMRDEVGPIGGKGQKSEYDVGCRYNPKRLVARIQEIYKVLAGRVQGLALDFDELIPQWDHDDVLIYCDPPYYRKGHKLYRAVMSHGDHLRLRETLASLRHAKFVISYDDCEEIRKLYKGFQIRELQAFYSVSIEKKSRKGGDEIVITR
jgi:DNA adenine methylase